MHVINVSCNYSFLMYDKIKRTQIRENCTLSLFTSNLQLQEAILYQRKYAKEQCSQMTTTNWNSFYRTSKKIHCILRSVRCYISIFLSLSNSYRGYWFSFGTSTSDTNESYFYWRRMGLYLRFTIMIIY